MTRFAPLQSPSWAFLSHSLLILAVATAAGAQPTLTKVFTPNTIGPGSVSTITFTITNGSASPVTGLAFTDSLPVAPGPMTIADPANASTDCDLGGSGTLSAPDGGSSITLSDAQIGGSQVCTITADATAGPPGAHTNPAITLSSSAGSSMSLPIDLTVSTALPGFSKSFAPSSIPLGDRSTLTFTIDNELNASRVGNLDFTDNLPPGIVVADPATASTDCVSASAPNTTLTALPGTSVITLDANGSTFPPGFEVLPIGATCTVTVDVTGTGAGMLDNVTNELLADSTSAGKASDTLAVTVTPLALTKSFTDDPVPPGGTVTLELTIDNFDRNFSATGVAFTDDLTTLVPPLAGLTFSSLLSNDCGGSVSGVGGTTIGLSGGTVAPESSCTLRVSLTVPAGATPGTYANTTSTVTATVDGSPVVGNMASDDLFVEPVPVLTKEFLEAGTLAPNPVINPGDDVVIRFTITNTSTTSMATGITFVDELTDGGPSTGFLPFPLMVTLPPVPDPPCGVGSSLGLIFIDVDRQGLQLTGGSLEAAPGPGDSCSFDVTVTVPADLAPGVYTNTTEVITATVDGATRTGDPASDALTVIAAPELLKTFTDDPVAPGGTVTLELTLLLSPNSPTAATGISFTDDLAAALAGLTANLPPSPDPPCGAGSSLTGSVGDTFLTFAGGTLMPGESCIFSVTLDVPALADPGTYINTTSDVGATVLATPVTSPAASDDLKVSGLVFSKEFLGDPAIAGDTVTLRFTIANIHPTDDATITSFDDNLAANLPGLAATGGPSVNTCGGVLSGTTSLSYTGGSVLSGQMCTIEVEVLVPPGAADGTYGNVTSTLSANQGGAIAVDPAADFLVVDSNRLQLTKAFTDDPVAPGDPVTLELTLTNLDAIQAASGVDFTDDLGAALAGLTFDSVLLDTCGGTVGGTGTTMITVSGVSLAASASCILRLSLTVPGAAGGGVYTNATSTVTGTMGGLPVSGEAASDALEVVQLLVFSKSFDGPTTATGMATLSFTITNPGTESATNLSFSDDLDDTISGLIATALPSLPCGAGSSLTGIGFLTFTGGELPPMGGTCTFDVDVLVPLTATAGTFPNTTSELFQSGLPVADPATADLVIEPPPTFAKTFMPDTVGVGFTSTLTFTIDNTASSFAASSLDFTDNLPAGLLVATPPNASTTCTDGTLTAVAGSSVVSYSGGTIGAGLSCTVQVDVVTTSTGVIINTSGDLTSSSGSSGTAEAMLTVGDLDPPAVTAVSTAAGPLAECDTVRPEIANLDVTIEDNVGAIVGAGLASSYLLVGAGPDGDFATAACGGAAGDDVPIEIVSLSLTSVDPTLVDVDLGFATLAGGLYRFFVCDSITDAAGNALDGDGDMSPGVDFVVPFFRADPLNLFENGHFDDCPVSLDPWISTVTTPNTIMPGVPGTDDVAASPLSASAHLMHTVDEPSSLAQCVQVVGSSVHQLQARLRFEASAGVLATFIARCELFDAAACAGASLGTTSTAALIADEGGSWLPIDTEVPITPGAQSALCDFAVQAVGADPAFDLFLDGLFLGMEAAIFVDGFESGDTAAWSLTVP